MGKLKSVVGPALREDTLAYYGKVSTYTNITHFKSNDLAGIQDDDYFKDWYVYVVRDAAGTGAAPQNEQQQISASTSRDGTFAHAAFTVPLAFDDLVLILHEDIAITQTILANILAIINERLVTSENSPSLVAEDETFRFAVTVIDNNTGPIALADITEGTYDLHRIRAGVETPIAAGVAFSKLVGMVYTDIDFATADWDPDDAYLVLPNFDTTVVIGGNTYYVPMTGWSGLVHSLTNIEGKIDALLADVGDASASPLGSLYDILGNPAQPFSAEIEFENLYTPEYGLNWTDLGAIGIGGLYVMPYLGNGIVVLGDDLDHILRSVDYGFTWTDLGAITGGGTWAAVYLGNGIVIFCDGDNHILRSTDYGLTWADLDVITTATSYAAITYLGNGIVVLGDAANHVFRSTDYGATWADLGDITAATITAMTYLGNGIVVLGDTSFHVWRSMDYGLTWADLDVITTAAIWSMAYLGNGLALLGDGANHIFRSTDYGISWDDLGAIATDAINTITYLGNGVVVFGDASNHVFRSTDYGVSWDDLGVAATGAITAITHLGNGIVLVCDDANHVWRSAPSSAVSIPPLPKIEVQDVVIYPAAEDMATTELDGDGTSPNYLTESSQSNINEAAGEANPAWTEDINFEQAETITIISIYAELHWAQKQTGGGTSSVKMQISGDGGTTWVDLTDNVAEAGLVYADKTRAGVGRWITAITPGTNQLQLRLVQWGGTTSSEVKLRENTYLRITYRKS